MTRLKCNVKNCVHNADSCCCKSAITVDGYKAKDTDDTCCASFDESRGGMFTNLFKTPENRLEVSCDAECCSYNEDHCCRAAEIAISGENACQCGQTRCSTFKARK